MDYHDEDALDNAAGKVRHLSDVVSTSFDGFFWRSSRPAAATTCPGGHYIAATKADIHNTVQHGAWTWEEDKLLAQYQVCHIDWRLSVRVCCIFSGTFAHLDDASHM